MSVKSKGDSLLDIEQVEASAQRPEQVIQQLYLDKRVRQKQSSPALGFNFIQDLIIQPLRNGGKTALQLTESRSEHVSYSALARAIAITTLGLQENGVTSGDTLMLVNLPDLSLLVHILSAMHLGCVFCVADMPRDNRFERFLLGQKIASITPDHIIANTQAELLWFSESVEPPRCRLHVADMVSTPLRCSDDFLLNSVKKDAAIYSADEPVCIEFDSDSSDTCKPYKLTAGMFFESLMLSSIYTLDLKKNDTLAVLNPGALRYQLMLSSLFAGGCFKTLSSGSSMLRGNGTLRKFKWLSKLLDWRTNTILLLTPALRDLIIEQSVYIRQCRRYFILDDDNQSQRWQRFYQRKYLHAKPALMGVIWHRVLGGIGALSYKNAETDTFSVLPLPGRVHILVDKQTGTASLNGFGYCAYPLSDNALYITRYGKLSYGDKVSYFNEINTPSYPYTDILGYLTNNTVNECWWVSYHFLADNPPQLQVLYCARPDAENAIDRDTCYHNVKHSTQRLLTDAHAEAPEQSETALTHIRYAYRYLGNESSPDMLIPDLQANPDALAAKSKLAIYNTLSEIRYLLDTSLTKS
ncbi:hypothetical protein [Pseudoalteromonas rubra]|uniref:AMP-dependent synthetase/ligase domain-containing protein n=1 Tax=Pseudoalteromonas rubra TaxID=43658 RepID=A0A5S3X3J7_9GAMM|nr:hypothetical protein [Pseudoalteromonas rubra]TMP38371.1 hypothetical protein CWB98_06465 [Pseudoalteromonas rubra]